MEIKKLLTSVQHSSFEDMDGVVHGLESESRRRLLGFGVELTLPFWALSVLSLLMQNLLKNSSMFSSRCSKSLDVMVRC